MMQKNTKKKIAPVVVAVLVVGVGGAPRRGGGLMDGWMDGWKSG